jgi:hypothetical protein
MAKKMIESLTDDIDGTPADRTVLFSYDGSSYEIELSKKNRTAFDKAVAPYVKAARVVRGTSGAASGRTRKRATKHRDLGEIRNWANENGYSVSDRGRVPIKVIEAYEAAR